MYRWCMKKQHHLISTHYRNFIKSYQALYHSFPHDTIVVIPRLDIMGKSRVSYFYHPTCVSIFGAPTLSFGDYKLN